MINPKQNSLSEIFQWRRRRRDWHHTGCLEEEKMKEENSSHGLSEQTSLQGSIPAFPSRTGWGGIRFCRQSCCPLSKSACQSFYQSFCSLQMMSLLKSWFGQSSLTMWYCFNRNILQIITWGSKEKWRHYKNMNPIQRQGLLDDY